MANNEGHSLYFTEAQLCERLDVSPRTVQRWRRDGNGPAWTRLGTRRIGYAKAAVATWEASRTYADRATEVARKTVAA